MLYWYFLNYLSKNVSNWCPQTDVFLMWCPHAIVISSGELHFNFCSLRFNLLRLNHSPPIANGHVIKWQEADDKSCRGPTCSKWGFNPFNTTRLFALVIRNGVKVSAKKVLYWTAQKRASSDNDYTRRRPGNRMCCWFMVRACSVC